MLIEAPRDFQGHQLMSMQVDLIRLDEIQVTYQQSIKEITMHKYKQCTVEQHDCFNECKRLSVIIFHQIIVSSKVNVQVLCNA